MDDMFPGAHGKLNIELPEKSQKPQPKQGKDTRSYSNPQAESEPGVVGSVHHPPFPFGWLHLGQPHPQRAAKTVAEEKARKRTQVAESPAPYHEWEREQRDDYPCSRQH